MCLSVGQLTPATVVDHITPHKGDPILFWDESNWQALCTSHHNSTKQRLEKGSLFTATNVDGLPLDVEHHWNTT